MLRINRFDEEIDEEEIKNIFNNLTDNGFSFRIFQWGSPQLNILLESKQKGYIMSKENYGGSGSGSINFTENLKLTEDLYGDLHEISQRLIENWDIFNFKFYYPTVSPGNFWISFTLRKKG